MLVLSRKKGETIVIDGKIEVVVLETEGDTVRLGIQAPKHIEIHRKEVLAMIQASNQEASKMVMDINQLRGLFDQREK